MVQVDTLRADHLPMYGYSRDTFPLMNARPSLRLWGYHSMATWTPPATASVMTSLDIEHHGIIDPTAENEAIQGEIWSDLFRSVEIATAMFNGNSILDKTDLGQHWDHYNQTDVLDMPPLADEALDWMDQLSPGQPFFILIQPMDAHAPWVPDPEELGTYSTPGPIPLVPDELIQNQALDTLLVQGSAEEIAAAKQQVIDLYDEDLLSIDKGLDALLTGLTQRGLAEETLVVLVADHGESLFDDHDRYGHRGILRPEVQNLPMIFYHPQLESQDLPCLSNGIDLLPTLAEALGWPMLTAIDGQSLMAGCRTVVHAGYIVESGGRRDVALNGALATDGQTLLLASCSYNTLKAYDLRSDPHALTPIPGAEGLPPLQADLNAFAMATQNAWPTVSCPVLQVP